MSPSRLLGALRIRATPGVAPVGLDLAPEGLCAVQLRQRADGVAIGAALCAPYPAGRAALLEAPRELRRFVRAALQRGGFRGRRVVSAMPDDEVKLMVMNYEVSASRPEPQQILDLVGERLREPVSEFVVDFVPVRTASEKHGQKSSLVAVARREAVVAHLERLRGCGLDVGALEIAPAAVRRLIAWASREDPTENSLVIHCQGSASSLLMLWGRRLVLYREIEFAVQGAIEDVGKALELPFSAAATVLEDHGIAESRPGSGSDTPEIAPTLLEILKPRLYALAELVQTAAVYAASQTHGADIDRVYVLGQLTRWPGATQYLGGLISLPVQPFDPLAPFRPDRVRDPQPTAGGLAVATGLALREIAVE